MEDEQASRNERLKATMLLENTDNLNRSGKEGVKVCSPTQVKKEDVTKASQRGEPYNTR
jgi:hypothetical protein